MIAILNMLSRARLVIAVSFVVLAAVLLTVVALKPKRYEAHMSFLVRNERADLLISTDPHQTAMQHGDVTEADINSEVELLGSAELLRTVVRDVGLDREFLNKGAAEDVAMEKATLKLSKALVITPVRKSALITVDYTSTDRDGSVRVLRKLADDYLQKESTLRTSGSAADFFRQKSRLLAEQLRDAEDQRVAMETSSGFTLLPQQRELSLQQMIDARKARDDADASLAETSSRLAQVTIQQKANTSRVMTQEKISENQYSVDHLNTTLVDLQNRRTELATKFKQGDRLLDEVDQQIANTQASLERVSRRHPQDTTTDVNPVRQALDSEAYRLSEIEAGLKSRRADLDRQLQSRRDDWGRMERASVDLEAMSRNVKELEDSLVAYREKAIAAGISEDLDAARISNVVVASQPIVPVQPTTSPFNTWTSLVLALLLSLCIGLGYESMYGEQRTAAFVRGSMNPVLVNVAHSPRSTSDGFQPTQQT